MPVRESARFAWWDPGDVCSLAHTSSLRLLLVLISVPLVLLIFPCHVLLAFTAYQLKYDSVHGVLDHEVKVGDGCLIVGETTIKFFSERDPTAIPWGDVGADVVCESTGIFTTTEKDNMFIIFI